MGKTSLDQLTLIDLTDGEKQPFARKVIVVGYYLKENKKGKVIPKFLFTVIAPKQLKKVTDNWEDAKKYKLPSGFSLIKGTREMLNDGVEQDIPPRLSTYFRNKISGKLKKKEFISNVDSLIPSVITALKESKEEAGIKLANIELIFDLGVKNIKLDGRRLNTHSFAFELKKPINGKAIDSLAIDYLTLGELKQAAKLRTRFNIPLVRPSHVHFVENVNKILKQQYKLLGITLSTKKISKKTNKTNLKRKIQFNRLVKKARQGKFKAYKCSKVDTVLNIIERSIRSRLKRNKE